MTTKAAKEKMAYWIEKLNLSPHPEGGYYREYYRSREKIPAKCLPKRYTASRNYSTSIWFLLGPEDFSAFHRLQTDEVWYFHEGSPLTLYIFDQKGRVVEISLGLGDGSYPQYVVPNNRWFAAAPAQKHAYSLVSCSMSPGFVFDDFELAGEEQLTDKFPGSQQLIKKFTRKNDT